MFKWVLALMVALLFVGAVAAQEATPEAPPEFNINVTVEQPEAPIEAEPVTAISTVRQWLEIIIMALLVLALGVSVIYLGRFLRRVMPRDAALALADSTEVTIDEFKGMADKSTGWLDNFLFAVSEPMLRRFVRQLRAEGEETAAASLVAAWEAKSGRALPTDPE